MAHEEIADLPLNCRFDVADFEIVWINFLMRASKDGPLEEQDMTFESTSCTCRHYSSDYDYVFGSAMFDQETFPIRMAPSVCNTFKSMVYRKGIDKFMHLHF